MAETHLPPVFMGLVTLSLLHLLLHLFVNFVPSHTHAHTHTHTAYTSTGVLPLVATLMMAFRRFGEGSRVSSTRRESWIPWGPRVGLLSWDSEGHGPWVHGWLDPRRIRRKLARRESWIWGLRERSGGRGPGERSGGRAPGECGPGERSGGRGPGERSGGRGPGGEGRVVPRGEGGVRWSYRRRTHS